ncbi:hypothetical protein ABEB36_002714 [Hypothenemus hampei]|uniref:C2H2-type domain-containing protein n=1 Tax=Hypothenemus hampei TaxID=57062 RepID=A0ABD1F8J3_HYPHA
MSGDIHSGVQDVKEHQTLIEDTPEYFKNDDTFKKEIFPKSTALNSQISTFSNTSDGALFCDICNIRVTSAKILQRHMDGRKHKSRAERRGKTFHCDVCEVTANSEIQLNIHLSSSKHKSRVAREEYKEFFDVSAYSKGIYVLLFGVFCIILNLILLIKVTI